MSRIGLLSAAVVAGMLVSATPASASNPPGVANVGSASFTKSGQTITIGEQAPCAVDGTTTNLSPAISRTGIKFGASTSTCTTTVVDPENGITTTKSEAKGTAFELSALMSAGGPRIRVASWMVTCDATQSGTNASWAAGGMSGFGTLPNPIPNGYVQEIRKTGGSTVLAKVKFTDLVLPDPNDGSLSMTMMRFTFEPASGITGSVTLGSTACSPTP